MNSPDILTLAKLYILDTGDFDNDYILSLDQDMQNQADRLTLIRHTSHPSGLPTFSLRKAVKEGEEEVVG